MQYSSTKACRIILSIPVVSLRRYRVIVSYSRCNKSRSSRIYIGHQVA